MTQENLGTFTNNAGYLFNAFVSDSGVQVLERVGSLKPLTKEQKKKADEYVSAMHKATIKTEASLSSLPHKTRNAVAPGYMGNPV